MVRTRFLFYIILIWFVAWGCTLVPAHRTSYKPKNEPAAPFTLRSPAFQNKKDIPIKYTCDGADISPPLVWHNAPKDTKSFVLICRDPDASGGTWIHWAVFNIPATMRKFHEKIKTESFGGLVGNNSWNVAKYSGPCPPVTEHRYIFTLYALQIPNLRLKSGAKHDEIMRAMKGNIIGRAQLTGMYQRHKAKF